QKQKLDPTTQAYFSRDHAWFVAFAPADDPEIAVVVLNEHGGWGAEAAAPAAAKVVSAYFKMKREDAAPVPVIPAPPLATSAGFGFAGWKVRGARRWRQSGSLQVRPSEFVKLAVIILLGRWFARDETGLRKGHYGIFDLLRPFAVIVIPVALVMKQPDLGTALVTFGIAMTMVMFAKVKWRDVVIMLAGGAAAAVFAWSRFLKDYQKQRLLTFLNPEAYAKGAGYHAIQSVIAVGSGQWSGKGWGEGTQNQLAFLPEQHTDFIFSVWAEEHGFLGGVVLIALYAFLVLAALDVAANARDKFGSFLSLGVAALFFWHAFINMGMVTGLLPVVGVPLPLFSYGGSSVVADMLGIGILLNVSLRRFMF